MDDDLLLLLVGQPKDSGADLLLAGEARLELLPRNVLAKLLIVRLPHLLERDHAHVVLAHDENRIARPQALAEIVQLQVAQFLRRG